MTLCDKRRGDRNEDCKTIRWTYMMTQKNLK